MVDRHNADTRIVFLLDVDNTLLNNDGAKHEIEHRLDEGVGVAATARFWQIYEEVRKEIGVVDIPLTVERYHAEHPDPTADTIEAIVDHFPYSDFVYPGTFETLRHLNDLGTPVILSDGDQGFQMYKVVQSGLARAVEGNVLLYIHKQEHIKEIVSLFAARHYVMIEDKPTILVAMKQLLGDKVTTILVKQGKYANEPLPDGFTPDLTLPGIGDVAHLSRDQFLEA